MFGDKCFYAYCKKKKSYYLSVEKLAISFRFFFRLLNNDGFTDRNNKVCGVFCACANVFVIVGVIAFNYPINTIDCKK